MTPPDWYRDPAICASLGRKALPPKRGLDQLPEFVKAPVGAGTDSDTAHLDPASTSRDDGVQVSPDTMK